MSQKSFARLAVILFLGVCGPATAFQVSTSITNDCHERFTMQALGRALVTPGLPAEVTRDDEILAGALQFDVSPYGKDFLTTSLMIGVRYNDLHGQAAQDLGRMAPVHNEPDRQMEHCLRRSNQDNEVGLQAALDECRDFIRWIIDRAVNYRDVPDPWAVEEIELYLRYRSTTLVPVSRLYFNLGRAIHVVQDSFSHTFRSEDGRKIWEVFNWIDDLEGSLKTERDGFRHQSIMDDCTCICPAFDRMLAYTVDASEDFLNAVLTATTVEQRNRQLNDFFDQWMTYEPGCTTENNYCNHAILGEIRNGLMICTEPWGCLGCGTSINEKNQAAARNVGIGFPVVMLLFGLGLIRSRRKTLGMFIIVFLGIHAHPAMAAEDVEAEKPICRECADPKPEAGYYLIIRGCAALDRPALAFEGSALYRGSQWGVALGVEYNPFLSFDRGIDGTHGVLNVVPSLTLHYQITQRLSMRFEARIGMSVLLFNSPGYNIGTVGLFLGARVLGLDWRIRENLYLIVEPIDVGIPIFKVDKFPFFYRQWRSGAGLAWKF
jgi:hypothetical protein